MKNWLYRLPAAQWLNTYQRGILVQDLTAALIVTALLIPQSLGYALLAGVPPEVGLYASILPLGIYALFGTSRTLSVGPVAVISLMTATALGKVVAEGEAGYLVAASTLALLSGLFLVAMGLLKLGFITNFISQTVISGFISASGVLIAAGQLKHILGITADGETLTTLLPSLALSLADFHLPTLALGLALLLFLIASRQYAATILSAVGMNKQAANLVGKAAPAFAIAFSMMLAFWLNLEDRGVALSGEISPGLPSLALSLPSLPLIKELALPALLISIISYVESIAVGKTLAAKRRQKINPDQELLGLGAANLASAMSGAFPVAGGFSRSIVNFEAGAITQMASLFTAAGIALASLLFMPTLYYLPTATLAATIIVAVLSLVDFGIFRRSWRFSRSDFFAVLATFLLTLTLGVEVGVASGVGISIVLHLYRTSRPHIPEVGLVPGTEHFRNINRYDVVCLPTVLSLRPDESLFFANAAFLEDRVNRAISERKNIAHVVLQCSAVNEIDLSALEMLEGLNQRLAEQGIQLHLSEVKGPVMDRLRRSGLLDTLSGGVYLSQFLAFSDLQQQGQ